MPRYTVHVYTSDCEDMEPVEYEAGSKREAADLEFEEMDCDNVGTIFVSNVDDPHDRASFQQEGRTLRDDNPRAHLRLLR